MNLIKNILLYFNIILDFSTHKVWYFLSKPRLIERNCKCFLLTKSLYSYNKIFQNILLFKIIQYIYMINNLTRVIIFFYTYFLEGLYKILECQIYNLVEILDIIIEQIGMRNGCSRLCIDYNIGYDGQTFWYSNHIYCNAKFRNP